MNNKGDQMWILKGLLIACKYILIGLIPMLLLFSIAGGAVWLVIHGYWWIVVIPWVLGTAFLLGGLISEITEDF